MSPNKAVEGMAHPRRAHHRIIADVPLQAGGLITEMSKLTFTAVPHAVEPPDFDNLLAVLACSRPARPTLFEFFLNGPLYERLAGEAPSYPEDMRGHIATIHGFRNAGYDYATLLIPGFGFPAGERCQRASVSMNEGAVIRDRSSFDAYAWQDPLGADYGLLDRLAPVLPEGMKFIVSGPGGVLENVVSLVGYETLCIMTIDDMPLVSDIFEAVGSRIVAYYQSCVSHAAVGAIIGNDDWGFRSQTMLPPKHMRSLVFPWHRQIVRAAHAADKPAILHSCGCLTEVMDDIIDDLGYNGKHSYEDAIQPVEDAYDKYHDRIAILGGIDLDFMCRSTTEAVYERSLKMLKHDRAYALGTGNSVPEYVPDENYFAMIRAALDLRKQ
jgi:uroporphyrinogen decarboxylase